MKITKKVKKESNPSGDSLYIIHGDEVDYYIDDEREPSSFLKVAERLKVFSVWEGYPEQVNPFKHSGMIMWNEIEKIAGHFGMTWQEYILFLVSRVKKNVRYIDGVLDVEER